MRVDGDTRVVEFESVGYIGGEMGRLMEEMTRRAHAYVLVYSITSRQSFDEIVGWQAELDEPEDLTWIEMVVHVDHRTRLIPDQDLRSRRPSLVGVITTNCEAEPDETEVEKAQGLDFAQRLGVAFFAVSATVQRNTSEILQELVNIYSSIRSARRREGPERERREVAERMQEQSEPGVRSRGRKFALPFMRRRGHRDRAI